MVLTSLNTYVAINKTKECIRLLKAHLPYFFSPGQWEKLWLIERSRVNLVIGGISVLATPELVWRSSRVNVVAVQSNRRYYLMSFES